MTAIEIIKEIDEQLVKLPEVKLPEVLAYVKTLQFDPMTDEHLNKIFEEDDELLRRLAQ